MLKNLKHQQKDDTTSQIVKGVSSNTNTNTNTNSNLTTMTKPSQNHPFSPMKHNTTKLKNEIRDGVEIGTGGASSLLHQKFQQQKTPRR